MKQTAVEWYYQQTVVEGKTNYVELLEQAMAIDREFIEEIHVDGVEQGYNMRYQQEKKMQDDKDV
jgi:hypothetical protein